MRGFYLRTGGVQNMEVDTMDLLFQQIKKDKSLDFQNLNPII